MCETAAREWLTVSELAIRLGTGRSSLYRMIKLGIIPVCRVGSRRRAIRVHLHEAVAALREPEPDHAAARR